MNTEPERSGPVYPDHLFTWLDVNEYFAMLARRKPDLWPRWLREVDAYWDNARFIVDPAVPTDEIWDWLGQVLGPLTIDRGREALLLDDAGVERLLPVEVERVTDPSRTDRRPRWGERRVVPELATPLPAPTHALPHEMPIVAFHSFKGGVGRTLHCVAAARRLAESKRRVLLIDGDLEAPGITWMVAGSLRLDFAFEDFLALVHGATDERFAEAISLGRKFLANQERDNVVVMPARRNFTRLSPPHIEPVDLLTADRDPYVLSEALAELGHTLGVDAVLIDLRAGISELSAPLLLDPRVLRVFVSTISDQSVRGTKQMLCELAQRAPARQANDPDCALILTQFDAGDHQERLANVAAELREAALAVSRAAAEPVEDRETVDDDVAILMMKSPFESQLLNLPATWSEVAAVTDRARLTQVVARLFDALPEREPAVQPTPLDSDDVNHRRRKLQQFAHQMIYAEGSDNAGFLATEALRNLAEAHRTELPIAVVLGSKGAGKTFTYLQLCRSTTWGIFGAAAEVAGSDLPAPTVPVLASANLSEGNQTLVDQLRQTQARELTGREPASLLDVHQLIDEAVERDVAPLEWRRIWLTCLALSVGLAATPTTVEDVLTEFARRRSVVFVIDGLEDRFSDFPSDPRQQKALRALLVDCPDWLRTLRGRPLGLVTFARRDLVRASIPQNFRQFEARYDKYALRWNREEALRLAAWICQRSGALAASAEDVRTAKWEQLSELMYGVWGEKMGSAKSKEARSREWFFAALSDFQRQLQPRDIATFLYLAANDSVGADPRWSDRILSPAAMRNALPKCSERKIEEIKEENQNDPLARLLDRLRRLPPSAKTLPFQPEDVNLTIPEIDILRTNGVVFPEDDQYWIPEIFRHGLGFKTQSGRRPRVIAVANLVRSSNDVPS